MIYVYICMTVWTAALPESVQEWEKLYFVCIYFRLSIVLQMEITLNSILSKFHCMACRTTSDMFETRLYIIKSNNLVNAVTVAILLSSHKTNLSPKDHTTYSNLQFYNINISRIQEWAIKMKGFTTERILVEYGCKIILTPKYTHCDATVFRDWYCARCSYIVIPFSLKKTNCINHVWVRKQICYFGRGAHQHVLLLALNRSQAHIWCHAHKLFMFDQYKSMKNLHFICFSQ